MKKLTTLALGACMATAFAGASFAASDMSQMTSSEKATMHECEAMSQSAMQQNSNCKDLMQKYPDLEKGTTGSASGMNGGSSGNMSGGGSGSMSGGANGGMSGGANGGMSGGAGGGESGSGSK